MAKKYEHDLNPLQVAQVASARIDEFHPWAASVARTIVSNSLGDKLLEKMTKLNALELENLRNNIARHLVICRTKLESETSWENTVDRQSGAFSPEEIAASQEWK